VLYSRTLAPVLNTDDLDARAQGLKRWLAREAAVQVVTLAAAGLYVLLVFRRHQPGIAWVAPGLGVVLGTAVPLQVVLSRLIRTATRG
jgi:hypothetical protein